MPSQSRLPRTPTRAPIASLDRGAPVRPVSNAKRSSELGFGPAAPATEGAGLAPERPEASVAAAPGSATAPPVPDQAAPAAPDQAAPAAELAPVAAQLAAGDLRGAANALRQIASAQRRLLPGGGDRALLQSALAALAVTESLVAAQAAKEAGRLEESARHATAAAGTLGRAFMLDATLRAALGEAVRPFGARAASATMELGIGSAGGATGAGDPSKLQGAGAPKGYDAALGQALARASARISGGNPRSTKRCYEKVADAVDAVVGRFLTGNHAYMAASQLAARKDLFVEVSAGDLTGLPAGAVVVWGKGSSESGHISIALGDGRESSDYVGAQMTRHYGGAGARVFLPKGRMGR